MYRKYTEMITMIIYQVPAIVRSAPTSRGGVLRSLTRGTSVDVVAVLDGWVELRGGGWLPSKTIAEPAETHAPCCDDMQQGADYGA